MYEIHKCRVRGQDGANIVKAAAPSKLWDMNVPGGEVKTVCNARSQLHARQRQQQQQRLFLVQGPCPVQAGARVGARRRPPCRRPQGGHRPGEFFSSVCPGSSCRQLRRCGTRPRRTSVCACFSSLRSTRGRTTGFHFTPQLMC